MAITSAQLQDVGLPAPDDSGLTSPELLAAFRELVENLHDVGGGAYAIESWERFQFSSDPDAASSARLALFCALAPYVMATLHEHWEREGLEGRPEQYDPARLGIYGRHLGDINPMLVSEEFATFASRLPVDNRPLLKSRLGSRPGNSRALAGFDWTVKAAKTSWAGHCFAWPFGDRWCVVTASWETPEFTYSPVLLGFAEMRDWHRSIGRVLAATIGRRVGPEPSVSTYFGFSDFEVAYVATSLHGDANDEWSHPLEHLDDAAIREAFELRGSNYSGMQAFIDGLRAVREAESIVQQRPDD
jgi:hypothetical protein